VRIMYQIIGLISSFVGSVLLAFVIRPHASAYEEDKGKHYKLAMILDDRLFYFGLTLLSLCFLLQLVK